MRQSCRRYVEAAVSIMVAEDSGARRAGMRHGVRGGGRGRDAAGYESDVGRSRLVPRKAATTGTIGVLSSAFGNTYAQLAAFDEADYLVDAIVDDRYAIERCIGKGASGNVFQARHLSLDHVVAVKVLRLEMARDEEVVKRFLVEARAASLIDHPNVAKVMDFGVFDHGVPYYVMEHFKGVSLSDCIAREARINPERLLRIAWQIADGLAAAHKCDVVHRDLKPANLFVTSQRTVVDVVKIIDFGVAKSSTLSLTKTCRGAVFGTPKYMAPEQALAQPLDLRADIYSLGVIMYEMACGVAPFSGGNAVHVMQQHVNDKPVSLLQHLVPSDSRSRAAIADLDLIVGRCLEKDPNRRYSSMEQLQGDLVWAFHRLEGDPRRNKVPPSLAPHGDYALATRVTRPVLGARVSQISVLGDGVVPFSETARTQMIEPDAAVTRYSATHRLSAVPTLGATRTLRLSDRVREVEELLTKLQMMQEMGQLDEGVVGRSSTSRLPVGGEGSVRARNVVGGGGMRPVLDEELDGLGQAVTPQNRTWTGTSAAQGPRHPMAKPEQAGGSVGQIEMQQSVCGGDGEPVSVWDERGDCVAAPRRRDAIAVSPPMWPSSGPAWEVSPQRVGKTFRPGVRHVWVALVALLTGLGGATIGAAWPKDEVIQATGALTSLAQAPATYVQYWLKTVSNQPQRAPSVAQETGVGNEPHAGAGQVADVSSGAGLTDARDTPRSEPTTRSASALASRPGAPRPVARRQSQGASSNKAKETSRDDASVASGRKAKPKPAWPLEGLIDPDDQLSWAQLKDPWAGVAPAKK